MTPRWVRIFRALSLVLAPALAWIDALEAPHPDALGRVVVALLGPLWLAIALGLAARCTFVRAKGDPQAPRVTLLDRLDVLTASGSGTLWVSVVAIVGAARLGWPSLSFVGVLGLALVLLVVVWTLLVAGGDDPIGVSSITRRMVPACVVEGDSVIEEVRLASARIPDGFRLFVTGSIGPRWATSRHAVDASASGGEVVLESDVGPALRGEHRAAPLEVWLEDVFGLCQSVHRRAAAASLTVLPRVRAVDGAPSALDRGGYDFEPRPAQVLPTEGSLRLREYLPGDDARRIHWLRSLTAHQVVMRLPDELPPDRPDVCLVLDTFLAPRSPLSCESHHALLDALVTVWLGAGRALMEAGARVTLLTAAPSVRGNIGDVAPRTLALSSRGHGPALRLGAEVRWQDDLGVEELLADDKRKVVVVSYRLQPDPKGARVLKWIVVPRSLWVAPDERLLKPSRWQLPHTIGSPDNRWTSRRLEAVRLRRAWRDDTTLLDLCADTRDREQRAGHLVAKPAAKDRVRLEAL
jgi:uncharacterized protein (DUF58 family)